MSNFSHQLAVGWAQLCVMSRATEALARANMGQLDVVVREIPSYLMHPRSDIENQLRRIEGYLTGFNPHTYHSISSPLLPPSARLAFDLYQVCRVAIADANRTYDDEPDWLSRVRDPYPCAADPLPLIVPLEGSEEPRWKVSLTQNHLDTLVLASELFLELQRGNLEFLVGHVIPMEGHQIDQDLMEVCRQDFRNIARQLLGEQQIPLKPEEMAEEGKIALDIKRRLSGEADKPAASNAGFPDLVQMDVPKQTARL